jgi:hypothetical protein
MAARESSPSMAPARALDTASVLVAVARAQSRSEVVRLALRGLGFVARRVAVFAVRSDGFHGWACNPAFGTIDAVRALVIPKTLPSVFATAAAAGIYLGPIPNTPAHQGLLQIMQRSSPDVAASAVRVGRHAAMIMLADELDDTHVGTRFMDDLSRAIGEALARLLTVQG